MVSMPYNSFMRHFLISAALLLLLSPGLFADDYTRMIEARVFKFVNAERVKHGLKPLASSEELSNIARNHSRDMVRRAYTSHINPDGLDPTARAKKAGFNTDKKVKSGIRRGVGENIYEHQAIMVEDGVHKPIIDPPYTVAEKAIDGWMNSPGHRKNIMNDGYTKVGTGVSVSKDNKVKITQVFF